MWGRNNVYVTSCKNYRVSSITEHSDTSDHRKAIKVPFLKSAFEKATQKALTDKEESIIVALKTLNWMVQENIPLMKFESFVTIEWLACPMNIGSQNITRCGIYICCFFAWVSWCAKSGHWGENNIKTLRVTCVWQNEYETVHIVCVKCQYKWWHWESYFKCYFQWNGTEKGGPRKNNGSWLWQGIRNDR